MKTSIVTLGLAAALALTGCAAGAEPPSAPAATNRPAAPAEPAAAPTAPAAPALSVERQNAIGAAENYIEYQGFSRSGLIEQLIYDKFSKADATYAVDHIEVNWNEQAAASAKSYLDFQPFSAQGLRDQLIYDGYTVDQASYGAKAAGL